MKQPQWSISYQTPILNALRDSKLVVFAGAGVSRGEPACLPSFEELANKIAEGTGEAPKQYEHTDNFLGRLQQSGLRFMPVLLKYWTGMIWKLQIYIGIF